MAPAKLLMKLTDAVREDVSLDRPELTIGRAADNDLVIDHLAVSAHHARIVKIQTTFYLEDLGSTNGTYINNTRIDEQPLKHGDEILIATHRFLFQDATEIDPPGDGPSLEKTVVLERPSQATAQPAPKIATLLVTAGKTDRTHYQVSAGVVILGADEHATIKLTGWFAPKKAAVFRRDRHGYSVWPGPDGKQVLVNHVPIIGPTPLADGDVIEAAGVTLSFYQGEKV
ncbi:FHA domain-containing protein [Candidatus Nitrospira bockiana]